MAGRLKVVTHDQVERVRAAAAAGKRYTVIAASVGLPADMVARIAKGERAASPQCECGEYLACGAVCEPCSTLCECGGEKKSPAARSCERCAWLDGKTATQAELIHALRLRGVPATATELELETGLSREGCHHTLKRMWRRGRVVRIKRKNAAQLSRDLWTLPELARGHLLEDLESHG